jgi:hypothetical protein
MVVIDWRHRLGREERKASTALKAALFDKITVPDVTYRPLVVA